MPGTTIPTLPRRTAQILGTVHAHRARWSPFSPDNDMLPDGDGFARRFTLSPVGGRHGDGVYAIRWTTVSSCHAAYTFAVAAPGEVPSLLPPARSDEGTNLLFQVEREAEYEFRFDPGALAWSISPRPRLLTTIESVELNGFVWDDEGPYQLFDELRPNHRMRRAGEWWQLEVHLRATGGLRQDGVYQLLFSCNGNEDAGFAALNDQPGRLAGGVGFGSSRGTARHSAPTMRVLEDGRYCVRMHALERRFEVVPLGAAPAVELLNRMDSMQLLGTVHASNQFDASAPANQMTAGADGRYRASIHVSSGMHAVNFGVGRELFLDTMACGAWLEGGNGHALRGVGWHGKPNEPNIFFRLRADATLEFMYDPRTDEFAIRAVDGNGAILEAQKVVDSLQLVGSFDAPLEPWNPQSTANDMERIPPARFRRRVRLTAGRTYEYKYTANRWGWLWVFTDYEYDGYAASPGRNNPRPFVSTLSDLRAYGQLSTHGAPPALRYTPDRDGDHEFVVDLDTGAYAVVTP